MPIAGLRDALFLSLAVALTATAAVALFGTLLGRYLGKRSNSGADAIDAIASLPLFLPPTVLGYYLTILVGTQSPVGKILASVGIEFTFTWLGAALASAVVAFPLMVRSARIAFEKIDREMEEAAALDGADRFQRWRYILLPMARSGLAGGIVLAFARGIGEFGATLMLSGNIPGRTQTMPLAIYEAFTLGDHRTAAVLSGILTAVSFIVVIIGLRLGRK